MIFWSSSRHLLAQGGTLSSRVLSFECDFFIVWVCQSLPEFFTWGSLSRENFNVSQINMSAELTTEEIAEDTPHFNFEKSCAWTARRLARRRRRRR